MVAVYKDPDGKYVFPQSGIVSQPVILTTQPADSTAVGIHEGVKEPETKPATYKVRSSATTITLK